MTHRTASKVRQFLISFIAFPVMAAFLLFSSGKESFTATNVAVGVIFFVVFPAVLWYVMGWMEKIETRRAVSNGSAASNDR